MLKWLLSPARVCSTASPAPAPPAPPGPTPPCLFRSSPPSLLESNMERIPFRTLAENEPVIWVRVKRSETWTTDFSGPEATIFRKLPEGCDLVSKGEPVKRTRIKPSLTMRLVHFPRHSERRQRTLNCPGGRERPSRESLLPPVSPQTISGDKVENSGMRAHEGVGCVSASTEIQIIRRELCNPGAVTRTRPLGSYYVAGPESSAGRGCDEFDIGEGCGKKGQERQSADEAHADNKFRDRGKRATEEGPQKGLKGRLH